MDLSSDEARDHVAIKGFSDDELQAKIRKNELEIFYLKDQMKLRREFGKRLTREAVKRLNPEAEEYGL